MSARDVFLVSYDITAPGERRRVHSVLRRWGDRVQYSVWRCALTPHQRLQLGATLEPMITGPRDQIMFVRLGPAGGRGDRSVTALGRPYPERYEGGRIV